MNKSLSQFFRKREFSIAMVLVIIEVFSIFFVPRYFDPANIKLILRAIPALGIVGLGVCFLMILGEFDLSVGSVYAVAPMMGAFLMKLGLNIWLSFICILLIGVVLGAINGIITVSTKAPSFIVTVGAMMIWRGIVLVIGGGMSLPFSPTPLFQTLFAGYIGPIPTQFIWLIVLSIIFWFVLFRTSFGIWVFSTGGNLRAARAMGVNTNRVKVMGFMITGLMAALGGLFDTVRTVTVHPLQGEDLALIVIAAVVIGGTSLGGGVGTIIGTIVGTIIIFTINDVLLLLKAEAYLFDTFVGIVIIIAISLNQIVGRRTKHE